MKRVPIRKVRSNPRPGRLKWAELEALRHELFQRAGSRCERCERPVRWENGGFASGHMHHKVHLSRGGKDEISNVQLLCLWCHFEEHNPKACPKKPVAA